MFSLANLMRQALLAASFFVPLPAHAEIKAGFEPSDGTIFVAGLGTVELERLMADADQVRLTVAGQSSKRSMPLSLSEDGTKLIIQPRFSLRSDTRYVVSLSGEQLEVQALAQDATVPAVIGFAPSQAVIPANTLRVYVTFSEPMARGQLRDAVRLVRSDGRQIKSPFLNLETELWDREQTRATMLLDPGRIKQGVGPNVSDGAPLQVGESYRMVIGGAVQSAKGVSMGAPVSLVFRVGPAERRAIDPQDWEILTPTEGSQAPFTVTFDRIMDMGAVQRLVELRSPNGSLVAGEIVTDGGAWSLTPNTPWTAGGYSLVVDPKLEDISGNTPGVPFDADTGTIGKIEKTHVLAVEIREASDGRTQ